MRLLLATIVILLLLLVDVDAKNKRERAGARKGAKPRGKKRARKRNGMRRRRRGGRPKKGARKRDSKTLEKAVETPIAEAPEIELPPPEEQDAVEDDATCLVQDDFASGTKIITKPGVYKLCENIIFDANAPAGDVPDEDAYDPIFPSDFSENAFGLGFFSAIAIAAPNVVLRLNGHSIEQSRGHALFQRYFAVIELANSPFIKGAGPAQFVGEGEVCSSASNVQILGPGVIGRSSHHGIHGNDNNNVEIRNVTFIDFEVAAVSLNNVDGLVIQHCKVVRNRHDVPVNAQFSAARFIRPYGKVLKEKNYSMKIRGEETSAGEVYDNLIQAINNVWFDVVAYPSINDGKINPDEHRMEYNLFRNRFDVIDGPCYAFVVHGVGPAVGGQGMVFDEMENTTSSEVVIKDNEIKHIRCSTKEIPAVVENGTVINDARGAVFQVVDAMDYTGISTYGDGTYKGNVVADMQIMVAKAILDGVLDDDPLRQTLPNTITSSIIEWAESDEVILNPSYRCNGDAMHHVNKGIVVIRVEDTKGFAIEGNSITFVKNLSPPPFTNCFDYHAGASDENEGEQQSGNIRGISVAAVRGFEDRHSTIKDNVIQNFASSNPNVVIGIDVQGDSKAVHVDDNVVDLSPGAGLSVLDEFVALRLRKHVDGEGDDAVTVGDNSLSQEIQILNNRRRLRNHVEDVNPSSSNYVKELEWKLGGCPFARGRGQKRE